MTVRLQRMAERKQRDPTPLQRLLEQYRIYTIRQLRDRIGHERISSQQAWNLWWGEVNVSLPMAQLIYEYCHIPLGAILALPRTPRKASRPSHPSES